jgi:PAS domain S-box-containing protein
MSHPSSEDHALVVRVLENMSDALVMLDRSWRYTYVNQRAGALFGRAPQDLVGKHIWTEFPEGVGQPFHRAYEASMADLQPRQIEAFYPPWNRWYENRICPSEDGIAIFFSDVTERRLAEIAERNLAAAREQAERMAHLGFWRWDVTTNHVTWSDELYRTYGIRPDEFGASFEGYLSLVHPDDRERVRGTLSAALRDRRAASFGERIVRPGGEVRYLHSWASVSVDELGVAREMFGTCLDLTELVETAADLRRTEAWLSRALAAARVGLWDWDRSIGRVHWSPGFEALYGVTSESFSSSYDDALARVAEEDRDAVKASIAAALAGGTEFRVEHRVRWPDGTVRWVASHGSIQRDAADEVTRMSGSVVDVTALKEATDERERAREALLHTQKLDAIGRLAAGVAHDIKNFLSIVDMSSVALSQRVGDEPTLVELVTNIHLASARAAALTRQLLTLGGQPAPELAELDLAEVIGTMTPLLRAAVPPSVVLETRLEPAPVFVDRRQIEQLIVNLVMNARDAMPEGGTLAIATASAGDEVSIEVRDTGTGMTPDVQARIFEPFYTTREHGSGVGMATVRDLVAQSRGRIGVTSAPGAGTTVQVILPRA